MKQSRPVKKRKKERTWAEAATVVLEKSDGRSLGIREILQKIFDFKLKDIKMNKLAENVLKTMLSHHANMSNCPFYKVKERSGYYALKEDYVRMTEEDSPSVKVIGDIAMDDSGEDSHGSGNSAKRPITRGSVNLNNGTVTEPRMPTIENGESGHESGSPEMAKNEPLTEAMSRRSNSYTGSAFRKSRLLSQRRTSSPLLNSFRNSNLRSRNSDNLLHRSRSSSFVQRTLNSNPTGTKSRVLPTVDLETPNSVLTNTRMKSVINYNTFSMLPASYQYQLIQLLPKVDRTNDVNGVPRISPTALNNEFFSQALQDWSTQLQEGEFTRETQARIMQELAKERSKISAWKEEFFEEYYGQKLEVKRSRSRSHDATSNLADLSFEAQVAKFQHLRGALIRENPQDDVTDRIVDVVSDDQDTESDQDPDFTLAANARQGVARRLSSGHDSKELSKDVSARPINRRKISKPFKRTVYDSMQDRMQGTALMHRKAMMQHQNALNYSQFSHLAEGYRHGGILTRPTFQIREEFYHSDSEESDTGELSDTNSFHQHDDSDEEGESSDDMMMNVGDNNLLDVDEDSESDSYEGVTEGFLPDPVAAEHSYTRLPKPSEEMDWRRTHHGMPTVMPVISKEGSRTPQSSAETTLVLRPRGNLGQTVQAMTYNEDSSSTSPEQPYKKSCITQPMFDKILTVSKAETSKEERVGVLFGRGIQSSPHGFHGDAIIPRISMTSLVSSPVTPTIVCTSQSTVKAVKTVVTSPGCHDLSYDNATQMRTSCTSAEFSVPSAPVKSTAMSSNINANNSGTLDLQVTAMVVSENILHGNAESTKVETKVTAEKTAVSKSNVDVAPHAMIRIPDAAMAERVNTSPQAEQPVANVKSLSSANSILQQKDVTISLPPQSTAAEEDRTQEESRCEGGMNTIVKPRIRTQSSSSSSASASKEPVVALPASTCQSTNSPGSKRTQPMPTGSPVKRTRTLAEIKAQMKAKRLAAVAGTTATGLKPASPANIPTTRSNARLGKTDLTPPRFSAKQSPKHDSDIVNTDVKETSLVDKDDAPRSPVLVSARSPRLKPAIERNTTSVPAATPPAAENDVVVGVSFGTQPTSTESSPTKVPGKIILKIKAEEGKKYTVKVNTGNSSPRRVSETDSDDTDDVVVRKSRRLSHVLSSSDDSSDGVTNSSPARGNRATEPGPNRTSHLSIPATTYTGKVVSVIDHPLLLKKTQRSPVFGEPAFEGISGLSTKSVAVSLGTPIDSVNPDIQLDSKMQPFMSDKPVIGFNDILSCTTLSSSKTPTFATPATVIPSAQDAQKYRSTSKGKSLVQMQQLARTNQIPSDESEMAESDTEDEENDSTISTTSSAEDDDQVSLKTRSQTGSLCKLPTGISISKVKRKKENGISGRKSGASDYEDGYSSSSNEDQAVITDCICACKRLVLCKGCGAYTHQECLSSKNLCSLCV